MVPTVTLKLTLVTGGYSVGHAVRRLSLVAVCYPFGEEIDAGLRPGSFPSRRRRWHDIAANPANPVEDRRRMGLYIIVTRQVERLAHPLNIPLRKKRPDVSLEAGQIAHCASLLPSEHFDDVVERTVGQTFSDAYGYHPVDPIVVRGVPLEQCPLGLKRSAVAAAWSDEVENRLGERLRLLLG